MAHVNGGATHESLAPPVTQVQGGSENGQGVQITPERLHQIRELLAEAFDPAEITWRVTATSTQQTRHGFPVAVVSVARIPYDNTPFVRWYLSGFCSDPRQARLIDVRLGVTRRLDDCLKSAG